MEDLLTENYEASQRKTKRTMLFFIITTVIFLCLSAIFIILYVLEKNENGINDNKNNNSEPEKEFLDLWRNVSSKNKLTDYIKRITKKGKDFVPKEDRIAVFDFDGTLFQETDPMYLDHKLYMYRVLEDPDYKDKATEDQKDLAKRLKELADKGESPSLTNEHALLNAEIYANMSIEEFNNYTKQYIDQPSDGYNNMKKGDAFYKPMLQVVEYLQKNDFIVYVVTGTDRFTARVIIEGHIDIPKSQIIGTEALIVAKNQGNKTGLDYKYNITDELQFKGELVRKNLNTNKVYYIMKEIGKRPILSFGNSGSDSSMAEFTLQNEYPSLAFMVLCDDLTRERGNEVQAEQMKKNCDINDWIPISMRNDWTTIYGDDVTKK